MIAEICHPTNVKKHLVKRKTAQIRQGSDVIIFSKFVETNVLTTGQYLRNNSVQIKVSIRPISAKDKILMAFDINKRITSKKTKRVSDMDSDKENTKQKKTK